MAVVKRISYWTVDELIRRGTEIHNGKYDYSLNDHNIAIRYNTKVTIKCNTCGHIFKQSVTNHINGKNGCPSCSRKLTWNLTRFIDESTAIHGDKFDYSLIKPNGKLRSKFKVPIRCKTCNHVSMKRVDNHIGKKQGCVNCVKKVPLDIQKFILRATQIHGDRYDYSLINPNNKITLNTRVKIKCKKCELVFKQLVRNHICGKNGCPKCRFHKN